MAGNQNPGYPNDVAGRAAADNAPTDIFMDPTSGALYNGLWVWNASTLIWEKMTQPKTTDNAELYGYNGTNFHEVRIDQSTRSLQTIEYEHHEVHSGSSFTCHFANNVTNIGEMTAIAFNTPAGTKYIHLTITAAATGGASVGLYEAPSIDANEGTELAIYNHNRTMTENTSIVSSIVTTPVVNKATSYNETQAANANISTTTPLLLKYVGTGGKGAIGGESRGTAEFVLAASTQYVVLMTSLTNDDSVNNITLDWYEHTDKAA